MENHSETPILSSWGLPEVDHLVGYLEELAVLQPAAGHALSALRTGEFIDREGRRAPLEGVQNPIPQAALLAWLAHTCPSELSLEIGFGMGMTASIILSARTQRGIPFQHRIFDPCGLSGMQGVIVEEFLHAEFGEAFHRIRTPSQFGIGRIASQDSPPECSFILVDGTHQYDGVMADFYAADKLLCLGGFMVFDDAAYPSVETAINFVRTNRHDYEISNLEIVNTAVLRKRSRDGRPWDHFEPFEVPNRSGWTKAD